MNVSMPIRSVSLMLLVWILGSANQSLQAGKDKEPPTKSIRGHVTDKEGNSIAGAKVYIRNIKKNITSVLTTDENGTYSLFGLDPKFDYEVHAEKGNLGSAPKSVSSFLNRHDTVLDFELRAGIASQKPAGTADARQKRVEFTASDNTPIIGDWYSPSGKPEGKLPAVLLLHDIGEDKTVWEPFVTQHLLRNNIAALSIDFRGFGQSMTKGTSGPSGNHENQPPSRDLLLDVAAALEWIKSRPTIDDGRIAVMGCGLGASVAFVASGKFETVRSVIALSAGIEEVQAMSAGIPNFQPHSILFIATQADSPDGVSARNLEKMTGFPVRVEIYDDSRAKGLKIFEDVPQASDRVLEWLKNTL